VARKSYAGTRVEWSESSSREDKGAKGEGNDGVSPTVQRERFEGRQDRARSEKIFAKSTYNTKKKI